MNGWVKTGTAFNNQPTYGDNPTARNREQPANQQGNWWIGGAEDRPSESATAGQQQGDGPQGTLTSPSFIITGEMISFLIGGGCNMNDARVELVVGDKVSILHESSWFSKSRVHQSLPGKSGGCYSQCSPVTFW